MKQVHPLFESILADFSKPATVKPTTTTEKVIPIMRKSMFRASTVYRKQGKVFPMVSSYEDAMRRIEFKREVFSEPKAFFSKIEEFEVEAVDVDTATDHVTWGKPRKVVTSYFV